MSYATDHAYFGEEKLVISIDIGTSYSSVACAHFLPTRPPSIRTVNRFPSSSSNQTRLPTSILYDMNDRPRAFGYETRLPEVVQAAREQGWAPIQNFKAQLIPVPNQDQHTSAMGGSSSMGPKKAGSDSRQRTDSSMLASGLASLRLKGNSGKTPAQTPQKPTRRQHPSIDETHAPLAISSPLKAPPAPAHIQKTIASLRDGLLSSAPSPSRLFHPHTKPPIEGLSLSSPSPRPPKAERDWVKVHKEGRSSPNSPAEVKSHKASKRVYVGPLLKVIYADWLAHLVACARAWFEEIEGPETFSRLWPTCVFVICHPADYGPGELDVLRTACELAQILPVDFKPGRLVFMKEPVAAVHFFKRHTKPAHQGWMDPGAVVLLDATEQGTAISGFSVLEPSPKGQMQLRPYHPPCRLPVGARSVSTAVETIVSRRIAKSKFKSPEHLRRAMSSFERSIGNWLGPKVDLLLRLADSGTDHSRGIVEGVLSLTGLEIEEAFTSAIEPIAVKLLALASRGSAKHVLLTGGLCEHPFIQHRLSQIFTPLGLTMIVPDIPTHTAVSEGALRFYVSETVLPRVTRFELGVSSSVDWSKNWVKGSQRPVFTSVTGARYIQGKWAPFVVRGLVMAEQTEPIVKPYSLRNVLSSNDPFFSVELFAHDPDSEPRAEGWMTNLLGIAYPNFHSLGTVSADLSSLIKLQVDHGRVKGESEDKAWTMLQVKLMVYMGVRGLEACVGWEEDGVQRRAEAVAIDDRFW